MTETSVASVGESSEARTETTASESDETMEEMAVTQQLLQVCVRVFTNPN